MRSLLGCGGRGRGGRASRCLGRPWGRGEREDGLLLLSERASSSVGRHLEQWIALESDGMIRGVVGKTTPTLPPQSTILL